MMVGKRWVGLLGIVLCVGFVFGSALAGEDAPRGRDREGTQKGQGKDCFGPGKRTGQKRGRMASEVMKKEFERFQAALEALKKDASSLRDKIKKAVQEAHKGEGKPTREMIKEAVAAYEGEAKAIAEKIVGERIRHHENIVSILKSEKGEMVERLTKRLLSPHTGPHSQGKRPKDGEGRGKKGQRGQDPEDGV